MYTEYEATFPDVDKEEIRTKLKSFNAVCIKPEFFMKRTTFNLPSNEKGKWLRVRDESDKITLSFKSITGKGIESQKESCIEVNDFNEASNILKEIGCRRKSHQENKREIWELNGVEIMIDTWPFLEPFVEIEGKDEESVKQVSEQLGFDYTKAIFSSVDELYTVKYGVSEDLVVNKTPEIKFEMKNPFKD